MRDEVNPEKFKREKNVKKWHRIIYVFHIPNLQEDYYKEAVQILDICFDSLVSSINHEMTSITLVNNNSISLVDQVVNKYLSNDYIDKYVKYNENKGKVYAVMNELRGIYEPFVTISDADVFFKKGWEKAVFKIFNTFKRAGVVMPLPAQNLAFNHNNSVFFDSILNFSLKKGKVVDDKDCQLYLKGLGNSSLLDRNNRNYNWINKQYFLKKKNEIAIIGAGHFVGTYRTKLLRDNSNFPEFVFFNGYEDRYLDDKADSYGYYRLSLPKTYAYHVGNKIDKNIIELKIGKGELIEAEDFNKIELKVKKSFIPLKLKSIFFKIIKHIYKL